MDHLRIEGNLDGNQILARVRSGDSKCNNRLINTTEFIGLNREENSKIERMKRPNEFKFDSFLTDSRDEIEEEMNDDEIKEQTKRMSMIEVCKTLITTKGIVIIGPQDDDSGQGSSSISVSDSSLDIWRNDFDDDSDYDTDLEGMFEIHNSNEFCGFKNLLNIVLWKNIIIAFINTRSRATRATISISCSNFLF